MLKRVGNAFEHFATKTFNM